MDTVTISTIPGDDEDFDVYTVTDSTGAFETTEWAMYDFALDEAQQIASKTGATIMQG